MGVGQVEAELFGFKAVTPNRLSFTVGLKFTPDAKGGRLGIRVPNFCFSRLWHSRNSMTVRSAGCRAFISRAIKRVQIELQGKYSINRLYSLQDFSSHSTTAHCAIVLALTAMPCLLITLGIECIPLHDPQLGVDHALAFFLRSLVVVVVANQCIIYPYRLFFPMLPGSTADTLFACVIAACSAVVVIYALARWIGFPVPFTFLIGTPVNVSLLGAITLISWGSFLRQHDIERNQLIKYVLVTCIQVSLTYIYHAYAFAFAQISGQWQVLFALLLPVIKRISKTTIGYMFRYQSDIQSDMVVLNADIYHVIFVSWCLNISRSTFNTLLFISMDLFESALTLRHIFVMVTELEAKAHGALGSNYSQRRSSVTPISEHVDQPLTLLDLALAILNHEKTSKGLHRDTRIESNIRLASVRSSSSISAVLVLPSSLVLPGKTGLTRPPNFANEATVNSKRRALDFVAKIPDNDRRRCLTLALQLLHISEFLLLVEFVEVIIPVVYGAATSCKSRDCITSNSAGAQALYFAGIYALPNRRYFVGFEDLTFEQLQNQLAMLAVYCLLEVGSFVLVVVVLQWKLGIAPLQQLAFVLKSQWKKTQCKLVLWVVIAVQSRLRHNGSDFTFQFKWLSTST